MDLSPSPRARLPSSYPPRSPANLGRIDHHHYRRPPPISSPIIVDEEEEKSTRCHKRLEYFARDSTIHGVGQILRDDQPAITRVIWTIAFLIAAMACVVLICLSFRTYLQYNVKTTTSLVTEYEIDFPAITVCNENMLSKYLVGASPLTISQFSGIVVSNYDDYDSKRRQAILTCAHEATEYTERLNTAGYKWFREMGIIKTMEIFALDSSKCLLGCWWKDRPSACSQFFLNHMTDFGWCFTLNPSPNLLKSFHLGLRWNDTGYGLKHDYRSLQLKSTGPNNGFKMLLNVRQEDYCVTRTDAAGFKVLIHDPNVQPMFFLERPLSMAPGFETNVAIRYTRRVKETENLGACVKFRPLRLFPEAEIYYKEACYMQCYTDYIYDNCSCTPLYGPPRANYRMAELVGKVYIPVCWAPHEVRCMKTRERDFLDQGLSELCKDCVEPCTYTHYDIQVSTAYFPADNFHFLYDDALMNTTEEMRRRVGLSNNKDSNNDYERETYIRRNLALANFYVESMQINVIQESRQFTLDQLVAEVGGQIGFLLGMSMLSLLEFVQCFMPRKKVEHAPKHGGGKRGGVGGDQQHQGQRGKGVGGGGGHGNHPEAAYRKRY